MNLKTINKILAVAAIFAISALAQAQDRSHLKDIDFIGPQFTTEFFDVAYTVEPERRELGIAAWDSGGSGATRGAYLARPFVGITKDGAFSWEKLSSKQISMSDYLLLGDYGFADTEETNNVVVNGRKTRHTSIALRVKEKYRDQNLLAPPVRFEQVWTDKGSKGDHDVTIFRMIPPEGYVALGMVYNDGTQQVNRFVCVKKTAIYTNKDGVQEIKSLVKEIKYLSEDENKPVGFWDDRGSGAVDDVALYKIFVDTKDFTLPRSSILLIPNVFFASNKHGRFPDDTPYALTLFAEDSGISDQKKELKLPQLTSKAEPITGQTLIDTFTVPYYKIKDNKYSSAISQALECPTYKVKRTSYYEPVVDTIGVAKESTKISWSIQKSKTESKNWSAGVAVEISAGFAIEATGSVNPLGVGGSTTITKSVGIAVTGSAGFGGETSTTTAETGSIEVPVEFDQLGVIYEVRQEYVVTRTDGTEVEAYKGTSVDQSMKFQSALFPPHKITSDKFNVIVFGPEIKHMAFPNTNRGQKTTSLFFVSGDKLGDAAEQFTKVEIDRVPCGEGLVYDAFRVTNFTSRGVTQSWLTIGNTQNLITQLAEGAPDQGFFKVEDYANDNTSLYFKSMWSGLPKDSKKNGSYYMTNNTGVAEPVKIVKFGDDGLGQMDDSTQNIILRKVK